ncbi:MAG: LysE family translocator [Spirochaetales bacterium]|nr:LysE family translocator [Spirochaetales bacterium]
MLTSSFLLTSLVVVLIPGTGVIYTVSAGLTGRRRQAVLAAIGCTLGIIPHLAAGLLGVSALMHRGALLFRLIKIAGIIYLTYLGIDLIRNSGALRLEEETEEKKPLKVMGEAILLNLLNPKLTLFFLSFLPQFLNTAEGNYTLQMVRLSAVFMGMTLLVFCFYGLLAHSFKKILAGSEKLSQRIQQGFGALLLGFATKLALED